MPHAGIELTFRPEHAVEPLVGAIFRASSGSNPPSWETLSGRGSVGHISTSAMSVGATPLAFTPSPVNVSSFTQCAGGAMPQNRDWPPGSPAIPQSMSPIVPPGSVLVSLDQMAGILKDAVASATADLRQELLGLQVR